MKPPEISVPDLTRLFKWLGVGLLVSGLGLAAMGLLELRDSIAAVRNGLEAEGRVVSLVYISGSLYRPRVEFGTPDGRAHTLLGPDFKRNRWYQLQWEAVEGEHVTVLYDPHDLGHARIKHFWLLWGRPIWLLLAGFAIVSFGFVALVARVFRKAEPGVV